MKIIWILVAILLVMSLCKRKENFNLENIKNDYRTSQCIHTSKNLSNVNDYASQVCGKQDGDRRLHDITNERMNCRDFEDIQIELTPDQKSWCKGMETPTINDKKGDFSITNPVSNNENPEPNTDLPIETSKYPFEDDIDVNTILQLDNKYIEKKTSN